MSLKMQRASHATATKFLTVLNPYLHKLYFDILTILTSASNDPYLLYSVVKTDEVANLKQQLLRTFAFWFCWRFFQGIPLFQISNL